MYLCIYLNMFLLVHHVPFFLCYVAAQFVCQHDDYDHVSCRFSHMMSMIIVLKRMS